MAIANQGYRRDLNLKETTDDTVALDNLAGSGTASDLSYIQNNLRNISSVSFNSISSDGFFSFENDRQITISGLSAEGDATSTAISIFLPNPYLFKFGDFIQLSGISESGATALNGQYSVSAVSPDLKTVFVSKKGVNYTNPSMSISGVTFTLKVQNIFAFTNGDVVNLSEDVTFNAAIGGPTITLVSNINYYVIESNGINKFKLSTSENGTSVLPPSGVSGGTPNNFQIKRQDAVHQQQVINFIKPQVQNTDGEFDWLDGNTINSTFDTTQSNIEAAEYFTLKKYRGDQNVTTSESIRVQGSIVLNDPDNYNQTGDLVINRNPDGSIIPNAPAPGIYISDTRAFSADNNPWSESTATGNVDGKLTTESEEVSIGELAFLDGNNSMIITGIDSDVSTVSGTADSFTHKIPIQIQDGSGNKETYYLLLSTS
jgi:hypothetical protein